MTLFKFMAGVYAWGLVIGLVAGILWTIAGLVHFHVHPLW